MTNNHLKFSRSYSDQLLFPNNRKQFGIQSLGLRNYSGFSEEEFQRPRRRAAMPKRQTSPKLVKITTTKAEKKYGVAAESLNDLIKKGCNLFKISALDVRCCLYDDGTILTEEYFQNLPNNSELVLLSKGESWNGLVHDLTRVIDRPESEIINAAKRLREHLLEYPAKKLKLLGDILTNPTDNAELENRTEDESWFEGIESRFKTKSSYMKFNCEQRIRGYLKEVDGFAQTIQNERRNAQYRKVVATMAEKLKSFRYHGSYFDRTEKEINRLCTKEGWFSCQGAFDQAKCVSLHSINPYGSRESRILFSTWNLDHRIEKKRTIIPTLAEALHSRKVDDINLDYFYSLLFTRRNLKLVHIVCHKKGAHGLNCDSHQIYNNVKRKKK